MAHNVDTHNALLEAAGELFAIHGFGAASVRTIAEKAGANVAAVSYHFGSKDKLYAEALHAAVDVIKGVGLDPWRASPERFKTPAALAGLFRHIIQARFKVYFSVSLPSWHTTLLIRSFLEPSPALQALVRQVFEPDLLTLQDIVQQANPNLSKTRQRFYAFSLTGEIAFYGFAESPILMLLEKPAYDQPFLAEAAEHVTDTFLAALGLPRDACDAEAVEEGMYVQSSMTEDNEA